MRTVNAFKKKDVDLGQCLEEYVEERSRQKVISYLNIQFVHD